MNGWTWFLVIVASLAAFGRLFGGEPGGSLRIGDTEGTGHGVAPAKVSLRKPTGALPYSTRK